ncbi:class I SAM-dependent methyltransferase [Weizmannia acidilactici]|uniref:class I SAM-dependent methyltransferase n=1 Tax=Weizmannia acidilactici TaxID=2607726 RepID=UPI001288C346|nr:class I SAM-dependent methyltransferase [Weizmannia acidilactici]GER67086.1 hypothetical protein BpJC4_15570 [Weizmannia acidilactici]
MPEIGSGSGINFPLYRNVEQVDAIEPDKEMQKNAKQRLEAAAVPIHCHEMRAEQLDFPDTSFDTVVSTFVFCTIPDPEKSLKKIRWVGKPGTVYLFFEHVKMEQPMLAKAQDLLMPFWKRICAGCHLNRNTLLMIEQVGFQMHTVETYYKGLLLTAVCM